MEEYHQCVFQISVREETTITQSVEHERSRSRDSFSCDDSRSFSPTIYIPICIYIYIYVHTSKELDRPPLRRGTRKNTGR